MKLTRRGLFSTFLLLPLALALKSESTLSWTKQESSITIKPSDFSDLVHAAMQNAKKTLEKNIEFSNDLLSRADFE